MDRTGKDLNRRYRALIAVMLLVLVVGMAPGWRAASAGTSGQPLDLAALLIHSDDLDWMTEEKIRGTAENTPYGATFSAGFTSVDNAVDDHLYALGRGGFTLGLVRQDDPAQLLEATGWIRAYDSFLILPDSVSEDRWTYGVAATIEEFESADGASEAFNTFNTEDDLINTTISNNPSAVEPSFERGDEQAMWRLESMRFDNVTVILTYWVRVDNLIVSLALLDATGDTEPDPETLETLMELQLKRLEVAEHLYQPHLADCAPRLDGDGVSSLRDEYGVFNGSALPMFGDSYNDLAELQERVEDDGIVDAYYTSQQIDGTEVGAYDGTMYFRGDRRSFVDQEHAEAFLESRQDALEDNEEYADVEALADAPETGDESAAFTYTDASGYKATVIHTRIGTEVVSIRLGSATEVLPESVFALAESELERLEAGDCADSLPVPGELYGVHRTRR